MATSEELKFVIRFRNEADAAIKRAQGELKGLAAATHSVEHAENMREAAHIRASRAMGQVTNTLVKFALTAGPAILAIREFARFEEGLISVSKTTGIVGPQLEGMADYFKDLSREVPVSTAEFLELATVAGQLGISSDKDIRKFTEAVSKMGVATDLSGEEAATTLARILNITEGGVENVDRFASVLVRLGNNAAASEKEISNATRQIVQQTARFGVSADQAAAYGAAVASMGIRAETAGTSIGRMLNEIDVASKQVGPELTALASITGMTEAEFQKLAQASPKDAMDAFLLALGGVIESGGNYLPVLDDLNLANAESLKVIGPLATQYQQLARFQKLAADEAANPTALDEEAAAAYKSFNNQVKLAINSVRVFAILLGEQLAETVTPVIAQFKALIDFIIDLNTETDGLVATIAATIAIAATLTVALNAVRIAWLGLTLIVAGTLGPVTLVIAAISTVIAALVAFRNRTVETTNGTTTWGDITMVVYGRVKETVLEFVDTVVGFYNKLTGGSNDWVQNNIEIIKTLLLAYKGYLNFLIALGASIYDVFEGAFSSVVTLARALGKELEETVMGPLQGFKLASQGDFAAAGKAFASGSFDFLAVSNEVGEQTKANLQDITENFSRDYVGEVGDATLAAVKGMAKDLQQEVDSVLYEAAARANEREFAKDNKPVEPIVPTVPGDPAFELGDPTLRTQADEDAEKALENQIKARAKLGQAIADYVEDQRLALELVGKTAVEQARLTKEAEFARQARDGEIALTKEQIELIREGAAIEEQARKAKASLEIGADIEAFLQQQREELEMVTLTNEQREIAGTMLDFENKAKLEGIELTSIQLEQMREGLALMQERFALEDAQREAKREADREQRENERLFGAIAANGEESLKRIKEAAVSTAAGVQRGFADAFADAIVYSDDLGASLQQVGRRALAEIISSLVQVGIQFLINKAIGDTAMATTTAASVAAGTATAAAWAPAAAAVSLASFGANAAPAAAGQVAVYGQSKLLSMLSFAKGGMVNGPGTGTSDSIPAWLSDGEFVMTAAATANYMPILEAMNQNRFATGGFVGSTPPSVFTGSAPARSGTQVNVPITIVRDGGGNSETQEQDDRALAEDLGEVVAEKVREVLGDEMRFGGMLNGG